MKSPPIRINKSKGESGKLEDTELGECGRATAAATAAAVAELHNSPTPIRAKELQLSSESWACCNLPAARGTSIIHPGARDHMDRGEVQKTHTATEHDNVVR